MFLAPAKKIAYHFFLNLRLTSLELVGHTCDPSYSGGRDQENRGSKPAQANSSGYSIKKKAHHHKKWGALVEWLKV
jgi:hypothetical protein